MRGSVEAHCCPDDTGYNHLCLLAEQGHGWKSIFTFMAGEICGETGIPAHTLCLDPSPLCVCVLILCVCVCVDAVLFVLGVRHGECRSQ